MANLTQDATTSIVPTVFATNEERIIKRAISLIESKRLKSANILYHFEDFERYLMLRFAGLTNEQGHVLYLSVNQELLAAETEFFGHQSAVHWDMRKVVLRAITLGAEHVVFAHNHPNGNPNPSDGDIRHLKWSEDALRPLNINLLDSYVVTSKGITSIKNHCRLCEEEKLRQCAEEWARKDAERKAKRAANKAAKMAKLQGASA